MNKSITDEKIISCLLLNDTRRATAKQLGITPETLAKRMKQEPFNEKYQKAKQDLIKDTITTLQSKMFEAISIIADVMNDKDVAPQTRVNSAEIILRYSIKLTETEEILTRIERLEELNNI